MQPPKHMPWGVVELLLCDPKVLVGLIDYHDDLARRISSVASDEVAAPQSSKRDFYADILEFGKLPDKSFRFDDDEWKFLHESAAALGVLHVYHDRRLGVTRSLGKKVECSQHARLARDYFDAAYSAGVDPPVPGFGWREVAYLRSKAMTWESLAMYYSNLSAIAEIEGDDRDAQAYSVRKRICLLKAKAIRETEEF